MLGVEAWMAVKDLKRQGHSIRDICRVPMLFAKHGAEDVARSGAIIFAC